MASLLEEPSGRAVHPRPDNAKRTPLAVLVVVLWFALLSSLVELVLHLTLRQIGFRWYLRLSPDFVWMTPVMDAGLFLIPAAILAFMSWRLPRNFLPAALFVGSLLFFAKCLILAGSLHQIAVMLLALGMALQTTRRLQSRLPRYLPFLTRSAAALAVLFVALALIRVAGQSASEQRAKAALPPPPPGAPNILVITLDTVGANHVSLYGYHRPTTPNLDAWAKRGATFKRAMSAAPWTLPSHSSMFTGRYPHELSGTWSTPLDGTYPTLAEVLSAQGYDTAGFVANRYYCGYDSGLGRGFIRWDDYNHSLGEFVHCSALSKWFCNQMVVRDFLEWFDVYGRRDAEAINQSFFDWLDNRDERPFFVFLNYFDAHDPYLPPPPFDSKFGPPPTAEDKSLSIRWWNLKRLQLPPERIESAICAHDGCIAYLDQKLGEMLSELERRGLLDNTAVIITSDHGEHFGAHGLFLHGQSLYRDLIHVPLVVVHPKTIRAGSNVEEFVTLRDLPATVMDFTGTPEAQRLPGRSWTSLWQPSSKQLETPSPVFQVALPIPSGYACPDGGCSPVASGPIVSLFGNGKYYIRNTKTGKEEIYDFENDPLEERNLALIPENAAVLQEFRAAVEQMFAIHKSRWKDFP